MNMATALYLVAAIACIFAVIWINLRLNKGWVAHPVSATNQGKARKLVLVGGIVAFFLLCFLSNSMMDSWEARQETARIKERVHRNIAEQDRLATEFQANRATILASILELDKAGKVDQALVTIKKYESADPDLTKLRQQLEKQNKALETKAKIAELEATIGRYEKTYNLGRRNRYEELVALDPENKEYKSQFAHYEKLNALDEAKSIREAKASKRKEGVNIGMSKQDVIDSSWGRPNKVNTTTTVYGTHEQWVYGDYGQRGFLYFDGDTLTSIQN
jgi:hypothetical protein